MKRWSLTVLLLAPLGLSLGNGGLLADDWTFEDVMVPMRDGAELATFVRRPTEPVVPVPAILIHTPYDKENARDLWFLDPSTEPLFASNDYAFVVSDWRGRFGSRDAELRDNSQHGEDGHDLVEWIAGQPWCDGRVGMYGVSALGRVQYWTATQRPPHLRAAVPIFAHLNQYYDSYYPGGVLRREYVTALGLLFGSGWLIEANPYYNLLWKIAEQQYSAELVEVPMLVVSGWYDLYNRASHRGFSEIRTSSGPAVRDQHRLLIGEWFHFAAGGEGIWGRDFTDGELRWVDSERRIQRDALAFYDLHLRGIAGVAAEWARVRYVQGATGVWQSADEWPPPSGPLTLFMRSDGLLSNVRPRMGEVSFPYDPDDPSPTVGGQTLSWSYLHGPADQDELLERGDSVVFVSEPLASPLDIVGPVRVRLAVRTTGLDTDFVARLTDVDEDGNHLLLTDGVRRLKLRDSLSRVSEVVPGKRYTIHIDLTNELAYTFREGHRVGLILTSSNFSRFDRNPNTGDNFYRQASHPISVTNTIIADGGSRLVLPVPVGGGSPSRRASGRSRPTGR